MEFRDLIAELGRTRDTGIALAAIRAEHGRGASRWIAETFGVHRRTAQKYLKGDLNPGRAGSARRAAIIAGASPAFIAAQRLRRARRLIVGDVKVRYGERDEGSRTIGNLDVDDELAEKLTETADLLEEGDLEGAEDALSTGILDSYGGLGDTLQIYDYENGLGIY